MRNALSVALFLFSSFFLFAFMTFVRMKFIFYNTDDICTGDSLDSTGTAADTAFGEDFEAAYLEEANRRKKERQ